MSLNAAQKKQTSLELLENYRISELTPETVEAQLGFDPKRLKDNLELNAGSDGESVWRLRDYMEKKIREQGRQPYPYSMLRQNIWYRYN